jgi:hypothetical protein
MLPGSVRQPLGSAADGSPTVDEVVPVHETSFESEQPMKADHYDSFAEHYSTDNESNLSSTPITSGRR